MVAREEDLATLSHEARRRGLSLGRMLGEVVAEHAEELRRHRRPRVGTFRVDASIAEQDEQGGPHARPFRSS